MIVTNKQLEDAWNNVFFSLDPRMETSRSVVVSTAEFCEYFEAILSYLSTNETKKQKRFLKTSVGCLWNEKKENK